MISLILLHMIYFAVCVAFQGAEAHSSSLEKSTALRHGSKGAHLFLYGFSNIVIQLEVASMGNKKGKSCLRQLNICTL